MLAVEPVLRLEQGTICKPNGAEPILQHLDWTVRRGEWVGIVGRNGSGKSTLMRVLAGLEPLASGRLHLDEDMGAVRLVMQHPDAQLLGETVWEDVCWGLKWANVPPDEADRRAAYALERVGLSALRDRPIASLSGGQKQLLAIAGQLALQPGVLAADEVTSMLDPGSRRMVLDLLMDLKRDGVTILMSTHRLEELAFVDTVIALHEGTIGFEGRPADFFYGRDNGSSGFCEQMGFPPPLAVRLYREWLEGGRAVGVPTGNMKVARHLRPLSMKEWIREAMGIGHGG